MNTYKPCEFAKKLNVSVKTLQRWDNAGIILVARQKFTTVECYTNVSRYAENGHVEAVR